MTLHSLRERFDPDLTLPPSVREKLHAADRAHNVTIARRWWGLVAVALAAVVAVFLHTKTATALEASWLRVAAAINAGLGVTFASLSLCAYVDRGFARTVNRHTGAVGVGVALAGYALIGVNAQRVTGTVVYFVAVVMVTSVMLRLRTLVFAALAVPASLLLLAGIAVVQRSPTLRNINLVLVTAITAYALANSWIFRGATVREAGQREALRRFNDELAARVDAKTRDLRDLAARLDEVIETERRHLARELHDDLGQELTALHLEIETLRAYARDTDDTAPLDRMAAGVRRAHGGVRAILESLRPRLLDEEGLEAAIRWLVARFEERTRRACEVEVRVVDLIDAPIGLVVFRVAQEALTNSARHAKATLISVSLVSDGTWLTLTIADDGARGDAPLQPGRGLTGMLERVLSVGGELRVTAEAPTGTRVLAKLPLRVSSPGDPRPGDGAFE